jgi:hypothetical protein
MHLIEFSARNGILRHHVMELLLRIRYLFMNVELEQHLAKVYLNVLMHANKRVEPNADNGLKCN